MRVLSPRLTMMTLFGRHRLRNELYCDVWGVKLYFNQLWETVMLVCLSSANRVSALAFLLAQSLDWVPRYSRSHLCSGSDIRRERVSSTQLCTFLSAGLHKLSPGS